MPKEEDIAKLNEGLTKKIKGLKSKIRLYGPNPKDGRMLLEACLVYYILFNRKRGGEAMWALLKDFEAAKGQLISECPFGRKTSSKIPTKYCPISDLKFFVASWGLPGSFWGLPVGFIVHNITY